MRRQKDLREGGAVAPALFSLRRSPVAACMHPGGKRCHERLGFGAPPGDAREPLSDRVTLPAPVRRLCAPPRAGRSRSPKSHQGGSAVTLNIAANLASTLVDHAFT